jgi:hypothetical protein
LVLFICFDWAQANNKNVNSVYMRMNG